MSKIACLFSCGNETGPRNKFWTSLDPHTKSLLLCHYSEIEIVLDTQGFLNHVLKVTSQHMCLAFMQTIDQNSLPRSHVCSMYTYMCKTIPKVVKLCLSVSVSLHYEMNSVRTHWFCDLLSFLLFFLACWGSHLSKQMSSDLNYLAWNQYDGILHVLFSMFQYHSLPLFDR